MFPILANHVYLKVIFNFRKHATKSKKQVLSKTMGLKHPTYGRGAHHAILQVDYQAV